MRRHILLHRQRRRFHLTPRFLERRRPLVKHILEQQELFAALGFSSAWTEERTFTLQAATAHPWAEEAAEPRDLRMDAEEDLSSATTEETFLSAAVEENALSPASDENVPLMTMEEDALSTTSHENIPPVTVEGKNLPAPAEGKRLSPLSGKRRRPVPIRENPLEKEEAPAAPLSQQAGIGAAEGATKEALFEARDLERATPALPVSEVASSSAREESAISAMSGDQKSSFDPQYWLACLTEMALREQKQQRQNVPEQQAQSERLVQPRTPKVVSQRTRTFLQPLVGIDPASVPVYQDKRAAQETGALRAEALNVGEIIELAPGHEAETPETLGLLAHELTHVARKRQPHFVPPIARPPASSAGETLALPASSGEEALAVEVERQVRRAARSENGKTSPVLSLQAVQGPGEASEAEGNGRHRDRSMWGELPAPWEPLPDWLAYLPAPAEPASSPAHQADSPPAPNLSTSSYGSAQQGGNTEGSGPGEVMRASTDRNVEDAPVSSQVPPPPQPAPRGPEPDLNEMAQQVYERLKRRLLGEQRRELHS